MKCHSVFGRLTESPASARATVVEPFIGYTESMPKLSAGLVMYRRRGGELEVLLVHPGGPFFTKKDAGGWSIPKGEVGPGDDEFARH